MAYRRIGNAPALDGGMTVTEGIVCAFDRSVETSTATVAANIGFVIPIDTVQAFVAANS